MQQLKNLQFVVNCSVKGRLKLRKLGHASGRLKIIETSQQFCFISFYQKKFREFDKQRILTIKLRRGIKTDQTAKRLVRFSVQLGSSQEGHFTGTECGSWKPPEASEIKMCGRDNVINE